MAKQRSPNGSGTFIKLKDGRVAWRQKIDGEVREISAKTLKELQEKIKDIIDLPIVKTKLTVDEWFKRWLDTYIKPLKKQATYNQYSIIYNSNIKPVIGKKKMSELKSYDIQSVISKMAEQTKKVRRKNKETNKIENIDTGEKLSSWTMKHARKIMNIAFTKAFSEKILAFNPVVNIEIPVKQAKPRKTLLPAELAKLFKQLENSRWINAVKFMLVTGLRRGELLALKWTDIDVTNNRITVDESNSSTGLGDTKNSKVHYVPLSKKANEYLKGQQLQLEKEANPIIHNEELKNTALIFPNEKGLMLRPGSFYTMLARAAKKAGIKASPHCLRHTFVYMNRKTLSLKEIQNILGHDESTTTLDIYGDLINESTEETAKQIDDVFEKLDEAIEKENNKKMGKVVQFRKIK